MWPKIGARLGVIVSLQADGTPALRRVEGAIVFLMVMGHCGPPMVRV